MTPSSYLPQAQAAPSIAPALLAGTCPQDEILVHPATFEPKPWKPLWDLNYHNYYGTFGGANVAFNSTFSIAVFVLHAGRNALQTS
jgi:hypothetical protein